MRGAEAMMAKFFNGGGPPLVRTLSLCGILFGAARPVLAQRGAPTDDLVRLIRFEDGRGTKPSSAPALTEEQRRALAERFPLEDTRRLGRWQRVEAIPELKTRVRHRSPRVRAEAINALAQAAQGWRGRDDRSVGLTDLIAFFDSVSQARSLGVAAVVARSLGRLPFADAGQARSAERILLRIATSDTAVETTDGVLQGLYAIARARRTTGPLGGDALALARTRLQRSPIPSERRLSTLILFANGSIDTLAVHVALRDRDEQVRRLALTGLGQIADTAFRAAAVTTAASDPSWLVRLEAARGTRALVSRIGCRGLLGLANDSVAHVSLAALDGLTPSCTDRDAVRASAIAILRSEQAHANVRGGWHRYAHALVAVARLAPDSANAEVRRAAQSSEWPVRVYAARAAAVVRDTSALRALCDDRDGNVREAALAALRQVIGRGADSEALRALGSPDYHVVLEAANGLKGAPQSESIRSALFDALDRLTATQIETSRDPRVALVERIAEQGSAANSARLQPYLADYDSTVAQLAANTLSAWSGQVVPAAPRPQMAPDDPIAEMLRTDVSLVFTLAANPGRPSRSFEVALNTREAPVTSARLVRLARSGYYNGLTFHRVEPGFVIQGGSPKATEYVGDGPFLRDELGLLHHTRGTVGISTRGRDTGDAQIFVNLVDNYRLDHDYTVVGRIIRGQEAAERLLEADVIERVEVRLRPRTR